MTLPDVPMAADAPDEPLEDPAEDAAHEVMVNAADAGLRLDAAAARLYPDYSRGRLQVWIAEGRLTRNGEPVTRPRERVLPGDRLALRVPRQTTTTAILAQAIPLDVVWFDDDLAIIDKPAGLVAHPGAGIHDGTLQNAVLHRFPQTALVPRAGLVHRLDKDTSGLLIVALNLAAHARLVAAMAAREIHREYDTIVLGTMTAGGTVDLPIGRHPHDRLKQAVVGDGRRAVTHYRVSERFGHHTRLAVTLETGRTHQIRVHLAHLRFPVLGDPVYGGSRPRGSGLPETLREALAAFRRQALHARALSLSHPVDGRALSFEAPLPPDHARLLECLRADDPVVTSA
jgi:23S rRNA pseudouridine1911/1915/1917 synthase